jgi:hypothetical protein
MNDLEQRLRHTLHELADGVAPSEGAKEEFHRRLARRRGVRTPALVAAAAVVVLAGAGVAIPLAVERDAPAPPAAEEEDGLVWSRDYDWLETDGGPFVIGTFTRDGEVVDVVVWVRNGQMCTAEGHHVGVGTPAGRPPGALVGTTCVDVPTWPTGPGNGSYVTSRTVLSAGPPDSGPVPHLLLFMTAPKVETLEVRRGDGGGVPTRRFPTSAGVSLFVADFGGSTQGFGYTAYDGTGAVVESAIT